MPNVVPIPLAMLTTLTASHGPWGFPLMTAGLGGSRKTLL
jgi:hypothetical protein